MKRFTAWRVLILFIGTCCVAMLIALVALKRFRLPAPTGPYPVGTEIFHRMDASSDPATQHEVVVQIWYPAETSERPVAAYKRWSETRLINFYESLLATHSRWNAPVATGGSPFHVLIFGPRWGGQRTQDTALAEELASHGYVVAAIDHPYGASRVALSNGQIVKTSLNIDDDSLPIEQKVQRWGEAVDVWAADDLFILNQLAIRNSDPSDPLHARLDTDHVGAYGHSFGGSVSFRMCGLDPRIQACINLDGWTFASLKQRTKEQSILAVYTDEAIGRRKEPQNLQRDDHQDREDRYDHGVVDKSLIAYGGYRLYIRGAQHLDFTDLPLLPPLHRSGYTGPIAPQRIQAILRRSIVAFFDHSLRGGPSQPLETLPRTFDDVSLEQWPAPTR